MMHGHWFTGCLLSAILTCAAFAEAPGAVAAVMVQDAAGNPLADARVSYWVEPFNVDTGESVARVVRSDAEGKVELPSSHDPIVVHAEHGELATWVHRPFDDRNPMSRTLVLAATDAIRGRVCDTSLAPIEGCTVFAWSHAPVAVTGADGSYAIQHFPRGMLTFFKEGYVPHGGGVFADEGRRPPAEAITVLERGVRRTASLRMPEGTPTPHALTVRYSFTEFRHSVDNTGKFTTVPLSPGLEVQIAAQPLGENLFPVAPLALPVGTDAAEELILAYEERPAPAPESLAALTVRVYSEADDEPAQAALEISPAEPGRSGYYVFTDEAGLFAFDGMMPGTYTVSPGVMPMYLDHTYASRLHGSVEPQTVELTAGKTTEIAFALQPAQARVDGQVLTHAGVPAEGLRVVCEPEWAPDFSRTHEPLTSLTDAGGYFTHTMPLAQYGQPPVRGVYAVYGEKGTAVVARDSFEDIRPGRIARGLEIILPEDYAYRGARDVSGVVVDEQGRPIWGAQLHFGASAVPPVEATDAEGCFTVRTAYYGATSVAASWRRDAVINGQPAHWTVPLIVVTPETVLLTEAGPPELLEIVVDIPDQSEDFVLATITDKDGSLVPEVTCEILTGESRFKRPSRRGVMATDISRTGGPAALCFTVEDHLPRVLIEGLHFQRGETLHVVMEEGSVTLDRPLFEQIAGLSFAEVSHLPVAGRLDDFVLRLAAAQIDRETWFGVRIKTAEGAPSQSVQVILWNAVSVGMPSEEQAALLTTETFTAGPDGIFALPSKGLHVFAPGHGRVWLGDLYDEMILPTVQLPPECRLTVHVADADGKPAADVPVILFSNEHDSEYGNASGLFRLPDTLPVLGRPRTDETGAVSFGNLAPGRYNLLIGDDARPRREPVELTPGHNVATVSR